MSMGKARSFEKGLTLFGTWSFMLITGHFASQWYGVNTVWCLECGRNDISVNGMSKLLCDYNKVAIPA